ncbi:hypothetical protein LCGC14_2885460, partial [marine sediment metagenome]
YIHSGGYIGAMVEVNCETDFVARTDEFKELAHHLAMQVAAMSPQFISEEEIPDSNGSVRSSFSASKEEILDSNWLMRSSFSSSCALELRYPAPARPETPINRRVKIREAIANFDFMLIAALSMKGQTTQRRPPLRVEAVPAGERRLRIAPANDGRGSWGSP